MGGTGVGGIVVGGIAVGGTAVGGIAVGTAVFVGGGTVRDGVTVGRGVLVCAKRVDCAVVGVRVASAVIVAASAAGLVGRSIVFLPLVATGLSGSASVAVTVKVMVAVGDGVKVGLGAIVGLALTVADGISVDVAPSVAVAVAGSTAISPEPREPCPSTAYPPQASIAINSTPSASHERRRFGRAVVRFMVSGVIVGSSVTALVVR